MTRSLPTMYLVRQTRRRRGKRAATTSWRCRGQSTWYAPHRCDTRSLVCLASYAPYDLSTEVDMQIQAGLVITVALVCGHLKSSRYAEYLAWTQGIPPGGLEEMDFRHKQRGRPADRYAIQAVGRDQEGNRVQRERGVEHIRWSDWGIGLFKVPACDYCDDVMGETADVSFGDAWLSQFRPETEGKNLVITRSELAERIVSDGVSRGDIDSVASLSRRCRPFSRVWDSSPARRVGGSAGGTAENWSIYAAEESRA